MDVQIWNLRFAKDADENEREAAVLALKKELRKERPTCRSEINQQRNRRAKQPRPARNRARDAERKRRKAETGFYGDQEKRRQKMARRTPVEPESEPHADPVCEFDDDHTSINEEEDEQWSAH